MSEESIATEKVAIAEILSCFFLIGKIWKDTSLTFSVNPHCSCDQRTSALSDTEKVITVFSLTRSDLDASHKQ